MPQEKLVSQRLPCLSFIRATPNLLLFFSHSVISYWSFNFSSSNEYSGLISFGIDWFDLLVVEGTLKSLLQHHSSKASVLWCSALFIVQLSHLYMATVKTITLTIQTFLSKVMSLLFSMLARFIFAFLQRSKHLLISWLQSPSKVILEPKRKESLSWFPLFPQLFAIKWWDTDALIFVFPMLSFKSAFSLSSFTFSKRLFNSSSLSTIRVVSYAYRKLLIFLPAVLIPACDSSRIAWRILSITLVACEMSTIVQ